MHGTGPRGRISGQSTPGRRSSGARERPSGELSAASVLADAQQAPSRSLVVAIPADHDIPFDRIADVVHAAGVPDTEVIIACAGQPRDRASLHTYFRDAEFLLAPADTPSPELRRLAGGRVKGDIVTFVDSLDATRDPATRRPRASVVIPVRNAGPLLEETLTALAECGLPRSDFEVIVVDDASADSSSAAAAAQADVLVRLYGNARGAAYARNRGAELARSDVLVFVDAGVRPSRNALTQLLAALDDDADVAAVVAVNDGSSGDGGVPTQYWNLLQQHAAQTAQSAPIHFASSCSAIRRPALVAVGMFDEWHYAGASVEDLDLGDRLHSGGHRVELKHDVGFGNVRPHELGSVLRLSWTRSSLITRLLGFRRTRPLAASHPIHALGSGGGVAAAVGLAAIVYGALSPSALSVALGLGALAGVVLSNLPFLRFAARRRGLAFAVAATPVHLLAQIASAGGRLSGWILRHAVGNPAPDATTQAFSEIGVTMWPPVPRRP